MYIGPARVGGWACAFVPRALPFAPLPKTVGRVGTTAGGAVVQMVAHRALRWP